MKIALLPLDERPVNTRYPRQLAAIAGIDLVLPPPELLPHLRQPADTAGLGDWLRQQAATCDALILSIETLAYGGLLTSRISHDPSAVLLARLAMLAEIKERQPALPIYAFNVITRISNANHNTEEPLYWDTYGVQLYRYSQWMHRQQHDPAAADALAALREAIPAEYIADFTRRRLRNHIVNLHLLELAADGLFELLVVSSDDTSEYGFGTQEKAWLHTWVHRLALPESRLLMYPGADEIGGVLLLRALLAGRSVPTFYVHYALPEDQNIIAPYEDSPVRVTVERQIRALGGRIVDEAASADFVLAVNTPSRLRSEYDAQHPDFPAEQARRAPHLAAFVQQISGWLQAGRRVIIGDVAYPNGSDPDLMALLLAQIDLRQLAAYGAWNTAGNTLGTALAQGAATLSIASDAQRQAQQHFLLHRFVEDWGYQHLVRQQVRDWLEQHTGQRDAAPETEAQTITLITTLLNAQLEALGDLGAGHQVANVRLPWRRTFEVDFDLEAH